MLARTALILVLLASLSVAPAGAATGEPGPPSRALSTPQLLDRAVERGQLNRATADLFLAFALGDHRRLPDRFVSDVPWDGTLPLLRLRERVAGMEPGPEQRAIRSVIESSDPGSCGSRTSTLPNSMQTAHFYVEYNTIASPLTIGSYTASLEATWSVEISTLGWAEPPVSLTPAPGNKYHVRIDNLGAGLYGFVSNGGSHAGLVGNNPNTSWNDVDAYASCMVLNRNYNGFPSPPQQSLDATTAHEYNHSIQFGLGAITGPNSPDDAFVEGGATWMEDEVFDDANDNYHYLWPNFTQSMGDYEASPYPYWVVFRALTERYGASVSGGGEQAMQDFWEAVSKSSTSIDLDAINGALVNKGTTLADAYHAAAVALRFNQACGSALAYPYCLEEGPAYVALNGPPPGQGSIGSVGGSFSGSVRDNYALNWVTLPASGAYDVTLDNTSPAGQLRGTVACASGAGLSLFALPEVVGPGPTTTLVGFDPVGAGCSSAPVAVITNQSQTAASPSSSALRSYQISTAAPGVTHPLGVTLAGSGSGTVTSDPAGITCPDDCIESYPANTTVSLTAVAEPGSSFEGWSGACSSSPCVVDMTTAQSVTAIFEDQSHDLIVAVGGSGTGSVTSNPPGIGCPGDCTASYSDGTAVSLTALPAEGSKLSTWAGSCSGTTTTCNLTMSGDRSVTAIFELGGGSAPSPKSVDLRAKPRKVDAGERTRLRAVVSPCPGHEGDIVQFFRGKKKVAMKRSNGSCVAKVKVKVPRTSRFRAVSPKQDDDHLKGTSNKVKVRVRPA